MCTAIMPVVILSDMFDVTTMDVCEKMFDHVESNVNVLKEPQFFMACKNNLLRMCNGKITFYSYQTFKMLWCSRCSKFSLDYLIESEKKITIIVK